MITAPLVLLAALLWHSRAEGPFQELTLDQALAAAKRDNKVVMIDFFTTWCGPCKRLDATTWKDPDVVRWLSEKTVALKLDAEKEKDLADKHRIRSYPTLLFLKPDGTEMDRLTGYKAPKEFLAAAADTLAGKNAVTRAKEKLVGSENDPMARSDYANALVDAGRYEEALTEYLWCFDNGKKSMGYGGVRLSFLLSDIARLGKEFPPARKALEERRDAAAARLVAGSEAMDDAQEAAAIDRVLETPERTLALYDELRKLRPVPQNVRIAFGREILAPLVDARRYRDAIELFDKPEGFVTGHIRMMKGMPRLEPPSEETRKAMEEVERHSRQTTVHQCAKMYEALLGVERKDVAAKVADHLIEFCPTGYTYATLVLSAVRAGSNEEARSLGNRGLKELPEAEHSSVREALATIPESK